MTKKSSGAAATNTEKVVPLVNSAAVPITGFARVYCTQHNEVLLRTASLHLVDFRTAVEQGRTVHDVEGPSMLMKVPKFDIVKSFVTEYMHCLQGIMKAMLSFWFDSRHLEESYYLGRMVAQ